MEMPLFLKKVQSIIYEYRNRDLKYSEAVQILDPMVYEMYQILYIQDDYMDIYTHNAIMYSIKNTITNVLRNNNIKIKN